MTDNMGNVDTTKLLASIVLLLEEQNMLLMAMDPYGRGRAAIDKRNKTGGI